MLKSISLDVCTLYDDRVEVNFLIHFEPKEVDLVYNKLQSKRYFSCNIISGTYKRTIFFENLNYSNTLGEARYTFVSNGKNENLSVSLEVLIMDVSAGKEEFVILESGNPMVVSTDNRKEKKDKFLQQAASIFNVLNYYSDGTGTVIDSLIKPMWLAVIDSKNPKLELRFGLKDGKSYTSKILVKKYDYSVEEVLDLFEFREIIYTFMYSENVFDIAAQKVFQINENGFVTREVNDTLLGNCFEMDIVHDIDLSGFGKKKLLDVSVDYFMKFDKLAPKIENILKNIDYMLRVVSMIETERGFGEYTGMINFEVANRYFNSYNGYYLSAKNDFIYVLRMLNCERDVNISYLFDGLVLGKQVLGKLRDSLNTLYQHVYVFQDVLEDKIKEHIHPVVLSYEKAVVINA